ncbi:thiol:disulfide interchange protein DsbA [Succinivibrio dextrinosolvens]|uniref:thiol:disulfide interchange protein DsbA/DsbL n=1 Tax=Succinivibrio dextrinosolvens TaxID=83771 RepID=UPI0008EADEC8|nr:thiol:disulfide interchange protein DsbA/DsbL [Succinivibrio dextrinosolvens]SFS74554.1 thiol:disulfide interchange protein DsbA [Succinivibrio dextrinosolvens]
MFKNAFKVCFALIVGLFFVNSVAAKEYKQGTDYKIVTEHITTTPQIREFFSFFCSHCYALDPSFNEIKKAFEGKAEYIYNPVGIIGGDVGVETQRAYAVALNLGISEELREELFDRIHVKEKYPEDPAYFTELFESLGVSKERYEQESKSFITAAKISEYDRYVKEYGIEAVPEIVVNGKYLAMTDNVDTAEEYIELIRYLLTLK